MTPVRIVTTVGPDGTVSLGPLPFPAGEQVEVVISVPAPFPSPADDPTEGGKYPLRGTVLYYPDPFGPACAPEDWEAMN